MLVVPQNCSATHAHTQTHTHTYTHWHIWGLLTVPVSPKFQYSQCVCVCVCECVCVCVCVCVQACERVHITVWDFSQSVNSGRRFHRRHRSMKYRLCSYCKPSCPGLIFWFGCSHYMWLISDPGYSPEPTSMCERPTIKESCKVKKEATKVNIYCFIYEWMCSGNQLFCNQMIAFTVTSLKAVFHVCIYWGIPERAGLWRMSM